jgi:hypothetical protein
MHGAVCNPDRRATHVKAHGHRRQSSAPRPPGVWIASRVRRPRPALASPRHRSHQPPVDAGNGDRHPLGRHCRLRHVAGDLGRRRPLFISAARRSDSSPRFVSCLVPARAPTTFLRIIKDMGGRAKPGHDTNLGRPAMTRIWAGRHDTNLGQPAGRSIFGAAGITPPTQCLSQSNSLPRSCR